MSPEQQIFLEFCAPPTGVVIVNDRVCVHSEGARRVVIVHGVIIAHYDISDLAAQEYAMLTLLDSGYADQKEIARAFRCSARSIRRYARRFELGGLPALGRTRGRPSEIAPKETDGRDRTILHMKERGFSNRGIAQRLGLAENSVRKRLRRLGWKPQSEACLPFSEKMDQAASPDTVASSHGVVESSRVTVAISENVATREQLPASFDVNPLDRSLDRLIAAMGRLEDATPMFACTENLPGAGVLLAIPALVGSGLLSVARKIYGSLGPAFYERNKFHYDIYLPRSGTDPETFPGGICRSNLVLYRALSDENTLRSERHT